MTKIVTAEGKARVKADSDKKLDLPAGTVLAYQVAELSISEEGMLNNTLHMFMITKRLFISKRCLGFIYSLSFFGFQLVSLCYNLCYHLSLKFFPALFWVAYNWGSYLY